VNDEKPCLFCEIRDGNLEAAIVTKHSQWLAFLDNRPVFHGHVLLVPRIHVPTIMELPDELAEPMMLATRRLSRAVKDALGADGVFVASNNGVSQSVDHLHIHVIPRRRKDGLRGFMWPRLKYESMDAMKEIAAQIKEHLQ
jgi:histidine triad (HIT) family protein